MNMNAPTPQLDWLNSLGNAGLGNLLLSSDAIVVYSNQLDKICWANVSGAHLFGGAAIGELLAQDVDPNHLFLQQLTGAVRQLNKQSIFRGFRLLRDGRPVLIQCEISKIDAADNSVNAPVIMVQCANPQMDQLREDEIADLLLEQIAEYCPLCAVCDEYSLIIGASVQFGELEIMPDTITRLISNFEDHSDPLQQIVLNSGNKTDAAVFHIESEPSKYLILIEKDQLSIADHNAAGETQGDKPGGVEDLPTSKQNDDDQPSTDSARAKGLVGGVFAGVTAASNVLFGRNEKSSSKEGVDDPISLKIEEDDAENIVLEDDRKLRLEIDTDDLTSTQKIAEQDNTSDEWDDGDWNNQEKPDHLDVEDITPRIKNAGENSEEDFVFDGQGDPVRFAWSVDANQVFTKVSDDLAKTVGPNAADIIGRNWSDIATVFGFDRSGDILKLLQKQDTWSGKSVLWPVQGTDLQVPVDLAALPSFSSGRDFEGFRGFGIVRVLDTIVDPDETGLALGSNYNNSNRDYLTENSSSAAAEAPHVPPEGQEYPENSDNIVDLRNHRDAEQASDNLDDASERMLSNGENRAFDEIGRKLRDSTKLGISHLHNSHTNDDERSSELGTERFVPIENSGRKLESEIAVGVDPENNEAQPRKVDTFLLERLPVPVMVYRGNETLFANQEFLSITGYSDFDELRKSGGIETLFNKDQSSELGEGNEIILNDNDGGQMSVHALLQSVPWDEEPALLLSFRQPKHNNLPANEKIVLDMMRVSELQNILDTATDGIIILAQDGIVQSINQSAEALFGRPDSEVSQNPVSDLFAAESHQTINKYLQDLEESKPGKFLDNNDIIGGYEVIGVEAKGGLIPLYITIGKIGSSQNYCAILRDMTPWNKTRQELMDAKKQAEEVSDQKTEFLARISHEIRTPLNAIIGFSDVMIEERFGPVDNERYREYLRDINRSGVHVLDLINDLLDISKIEAGKMELSFEAVDLNQIVGETVALLQPQANGSRVLIRTSLSRAVPNVVADARSIRQIVLNLVSNAIKFTQASGQVIVSTVYEGNGEVALRVRDTGRGMSADEVTIALKPFRQVNEISESRNPGTGLGLPLTKALVEANKAFLDIESEPGEGTIVHIQFPTQRVLAD